MEAIQNEFPGFITSVDKDNLVITVTDGKFKGIEYSIDVPSVNVNEEEREDGGLDIDFDFRVEEGKVELGDESEFLDLIREQFITILETAVQDILPSV